MIVICTGCQARFRVADEKIGPRGAKVRCTRCQHVFAVQREAAPPPPPAPKIDLDLTPGLVRPPPPQDPFAQPPAGAAVIPFPPAAQGRAADPSADPFAAAGLDAFGESPIAADDPFARAAGITADASPAPFPATPPAASADPFALDPFAAGPATGAQRLPVTDLAQLLGSDAAAPGPAAASSARPTRAAAPPTAQRPLAAPTAPPFEPAFEPAGPAVLPGAFAADLALEERSGSMAAPAAPGATPFADPADVFSADPGLVASGGEFAPEGGAEESLALATERTPPPVLAPPAPPPAAGRPDAEPLAGAVPGVQPVAQDPGPPPAALASAPARAAEPRAHRVRSAALNALALVALLILALAIRAVLRGDAALGPAALRPSTLLHSFGAVRPAGPFDLAEVRSGVYPQASGSAVLYVRGVVLCRPPAPVEGVRVEAELVRDGQVLSRGAVQAGAVPSPEEVYRAVDHGALESLTGELQRRAPKQVAPGDRLGFLITLGDAPADLSGTTVRLSARPGAGAPR